jgi:hypothetical protein
MNTAIRNEERNRTRAEDTLPNERAGVGGTVKDNGIRSCLVVDYWLLKIEEN